ncbi:hypothetical protein [Photobacterium alginatilyticum]|uniref:Uncharacterized protein n=1 Tax=Photobacterium alginatilyticum TaxID=1775171 RepID=A0ABW9YR96_9GAMM|nr:hypothetical protein [Photobacterium alginatilyticum]NBI56102.1 hypothetical protein [Photobacterium alginatilyticum]
MSPSHSILVIKSPEGKAITIFQCDSGWFWLKALVDTEGFHTPFRTIDEIALSQGLIDMRLLHVKKVPFEV